MTTGTLACPFLEGKYKNETKHSFDTIYYRFIWFMSKRIRTKKLQKTFSQEKIEIRIDIPESTKKRIEMETVYDGLFFPNTYFDSIRLEQYNTILSQLDTTSINRLVSGRNGVRVLCILPDQNSYYFKFIWDEDNNVFLFVHQKKKVNSLELQNLIVNM